MRLTKTIKPVALSETAAQAFARFERAKSAVDRYRKARKQLESEFGKAKLGQLPDGRLIMRSESELPANTLSHFSEILPWDD